MSDVLIIGGTGTLGQELTRQLLKKDPKANITIMSRDELKQQAMKRTFADYKKVRYVLGDIRDRDSIRRAIDDTEAIFHVAALKHIDVCEENPVETFRTNVDGTVNVAEVAMERCVRHMVFSSTDKAVMPINVYGHTKAIGERYLLGLNQRQSMTRFGVYRWANVLGSRGSVVHRFAETLLQHKRVDITDPEMTRFWLRIEDAAEFMLSSYERAPMSRVNIPPMKAASVLRLAAAIAKALGIKAYKVNVIGMRPGEKVHEAIDSTPKGLLTSDTAAQYSDEELEAMVRQVVREAAA